MAFPIPAMKYIRQHLLLGPVDLVEMGSELGHSAHDTFRGTLSSASHTVSSWRLSWRRLRRRRRLVGGGLRRGSLVFRSSRFLLRGSLLFGLVLKPGVGHGSRLGQKLGRRLHNGTLVEGRLLENGQGSRTEIGADTEGQIQADTWQVRMLDAIGMMYATADYSPQNMDSVAPRETLLQRTLVAMDDGAELPPARAATATRARRMTPATTCIRRWVVSLELFGGTQGECSASWVRNPPRSPTAQTAWHDSERRLPATLNAPRHAQRPYTSSRREELARAYTPAG